MITLQKLVQPVISLFFVSFVYLNLVIISVHLNPILICSNETINIVTAKVCFTNCVITVDVVESLHIHTPIDWTYRSQM